MTKAPNAYFDYHAAVAGIEDLLRERKVKEDLISRVSLAMARAYKAGQDSVAEAQESEHLEKSITLCDACHQFPPMHTIFNIHRKNEVLCCGCYVAKGYPPYDGHPKCLEAYKARKR